MVRAAIYARKSTVDEEADSVTRQRDDNLAFAESKGWVVDPAHVYIDNGVSGAQFTTRPEFQAMLRAARRREFEVVVLFELDRLGREELQTRNALRELYECGITVWSSSLRIPLETETSTGKMLMFMQATAAEQYRELVRRHTRAAMWAKARRGEVAGGKVFGYDNIRPVKDGPAHRVINPAEAAVVREIYEQAATGVGLRMVAQALNRQGVPKPRAPKHKDGEDDGRVDGWSATTVRAVLERPLYRGQVVYGRSRKVFGSEWQRERPASGREKGQLPVEDGWVTLDKPELRIVSEELAARVDLIRSRRRESYKRSVASGGPVAEHARNVKHLLSGGLLLCPVCGGHYEARKYPWKGNPGNVYMCATRRRKPGVCTNTVVLPIMETDDSILDIVEGEVLSPAMVDALVASVGEQRDNSALYLARRAALQTEVDNLVNSIAAGAPADIMAPKIKERTAEIARLDAALKQPRPAVSDPRALRAALEQRVSTWREKLRAEPQVGRMVIRELVGPILLHPPTPDYLVPYIEWTGNEQEDRTIAGMAGVEWSAEIRTQSLLAGLVHQVASPTGFEPVFQP